MKDVASASARLKDEFKYSRSIIAYRPAATLTCVIFKAYDKLIINYTALII